ncbi:MAG: diphosphate--fructose-6-phosphate 1-phosphotransferase [Parachlamydiales bacterium]|nr:diphosphate--fructose-6-phosphate 1-phosphotransferase [Parachlamydiales bacterium]
MENLSKKLQSKRLKYSPKLPEILSDISNIKIVFTKDTTALGDANELKKIFKNTFGQKICEIKKSANSFKNNFKNPLKIGVVFSGGQASGGHNVISGLFDALKKMNKNSKLIGFLNGPEGIVNCSFIEITKELIDQYRNLGGFDLIGSGRTKIETADQLEKSLKCAQKQKLDGIVVIGGDDSNTNAAILAEYFKENNCNTKVIGVPKTIDGDLKNEYIELSFGFDTACKVYSELIGNIARDALSAKKYYHFIRLMGRSASHIALECALKTHPNVVLIAEEIFEKKKTLSQITSKIADVIEKRAKNSKNYGIILIPEGLIEFIPEFKNLISELNKLLAIGEKTEVELQKFSLADEKIKYIKNILRGEHLSCFESLPKDIQEQLLLDRDPHGNVKVSQIETEKMLIKTVKNELSKRDSKIKFNALNHFFGYEGRAGMPSNFDANYCYSLGNIAAILLNQGLTGYICAIKNLKNGVSDWRLMGVPLTSLMNLEVRHGKPKPVIQKALIKTDSKLFKQFEKFREIWAVEDNFVYPGSIQYFGDEDITDSVPISLIISS